MIMFWLGFIAGPLSVVILAYVYVEVIDPFLDLFRMKDDLRRLERDFRVLDKIAKKRKLKRGEMTEV